MKDFLQGKWLGHPLHPALVHLPVGLWPAALIFDLLSFYGAGGDFLAKLSFYAIAAGLVGAALAMPTGLADWWDIKPEKPAWKLGILHMALNIVAAVVWGVNLYLRVGTLDRAPVDGIGVALSALGTLILLVSGYLGGRMVYQYGIGIARTSKADWRRIARQGGARVPTEDG